MIRDRTIIAIASNWHFDPTSKHHVMSRLAEHNDVLWVNYHASRKPRASVADLRWAAGKVRQCLRGAEWVAPRMRVMTPVVLPLPGSRVARQVNQALMVSQIRSAMAPFPDQPIQLWTFAPDVDYLVGRFHEELDLYYCVDEFAAFSGYDAEAIRAAEGRLMDCCDVVITTSRDLQIARQQRHPRTHLVPHGVDYDHFATARTVAPAELQVSGPVFGFFGMIADWVDLELITAVADRNPEWSFVLIGRQAVDVASLRLRHNVHVPGPVPYADLPSYCARFDVALIPFKLNELTRHVNPIKLREYLAAGLPVVSTDLPEVRPYAPDVLIGSDVATFEAACQAALQQRGAQAADRRQARVRREGWGARVEQISSCVHAALAERDAPWSSATTPQTVP